MDSLERRRQYMRDYMRVYRERQEDGIRSFYYGSPSWTKRKNYVFRQLKAIPEILYRKRKRIEKLQEEMAALEPTLKRFQDEYNRLMTMDT